MDGDVMLALREEQNDEENDEENCGSTGEPNLLQSLKNIESLIEN